MGTHDFLAGLIPGPDSRRFCPAAVSVLMVPYVPFGWHPRNDDPQTVIQLRKCRLVLMSRQRQNGLPDIERVSQEEK